MTPNDLYTTPAPDGEAPAYQVDPAMVEIAPFDARVAPVIAVLTAAGFTHSVARRIPNDGVAGPLYVTGFYLSETTAHPGAFTLWHWHEADRPYKRPMVPGWNAEALALAAYQAALEAAGYPVRQVDWSFNDEPYLVIVPPPTESEAHP